MFLYSIVKQINTTCRAHQTQSNHLHFSQIIPVLFYIILAKKIKFCSEIRDKVDRSKEIIPFFPALSQREPVSFLPLEAEISTVLSESSPDIFYVLCKYMKPISISLVKKRTKKASLSVISYSP